MSCFRDMCLPRGRWSLEIYVLSFFFFFLNWGLCPGRQRRRPALPCSTQTRCCTWLPRRTRVCFGATPHPSSAAPVSAPSWHSGRSRGCAAIRSSSKPPRCVGSLLHSSFPSLLCHAVCSLFETEDGQYLFSTCFYNGSLIFILNEALAYIFILAYEILVYHSMGCCACTSSTACRQ